MKPEAPRTRHFRVCEMNKEGWVTFEELDEQGNSLGYPASLNVGVMLRRPGLVSCVVLTRSGAYHGLNRQVEVGDLFIILS